MVGPLLLYPARPCHDGQPLARSCCPPSLSSLQMAFNYPFLPQHPATTHFPSAALRPRRLLWVPSPQAPQSFSSPRCAESVTHPSASCSISDIVPHGGTLGRVQQGGKDLTSAAGATLTVQTHLLGLWVPSASCGHLAAVTYMEQIPGWGCSRDWYREDHVLGGCLACFPYFPPCTQLC